MVASRQAAVLLDDWGFAVAAATNALGPVVTYIHSKPPSFHSVLNVRHALNPSVLNGFRVSYFPGYVFVAETMRPQRGHSYNNV
jgi:hypothetical protein